MVDIGVVVTTCRGREENLRRVLSCLGLQTVKPHSVCVVFDGCDPRVDLPDIGVEITRAAITKHEPGDEQPRNIGVWCVTGVEHEPSHVWFLDSDLIFYENVLETYRSVLEQDPDRVLIGPYDWLPAGQGQIDSGLRNDPRWASFLESPSDVVKVNDLGAALGCFGGNLVWPVERFREIGGFHPHLHHGRCEDGELGLRAASRGVPMSLVGEARAWHVDHPVDVGAKLLKNSRDVPLINEWHPWVESRGLVMRHEDGARFNFICPDCRSEINSLEYWSHRGSHSPSH